jgi:integrase
LALRWIDVDFERRTIRIDQATDETKANGVTIKPELKNESSRRTITISHGTAATLRALWKEQAEDCLQVGTRPALVFPASPHEPATPLRPREVTKAFGRAVRKFGFHGLRFHDLRHNCASHMLKAGRTVPDVAQHLGHSTPAITMQVYAHAIPRKETGAGLLDDLMGPSVAGA